MNHLRLVGFHTSQLVQDFFHQQYFQGHVGVGLRECNPVLTLDCFCLHCLWSETELISANHISPNKNCRPTKCFPDLSDESSFRTSFIPNVKLLQQVWTRLAETAKKGDMKIVLQEMGVYFQQKAGLNSKHRHHPFDSKKLSPGNLFPTAKRYNYHVSHPTSSYRNLKRQVLIVYFSYWYIWYPVGSICSTQPGGSDPLDIRQTSLDLV